MMIDICKVHGPDSFVGKLPVSLEDAPNNALLIGALLWVSWSSQYKYAVTGGLIADLAGVIGGIFVGYLFFH
jgi:spore maturation protein SpmB